MPSWRTLILHPLIGLNGWSDEYDSSNSGIDVFYLLTLCFALGLWLVFQRYQKLHNSPVPFGVHIPEVSG